MEKTILAIPGAFSGVMSVFSIIHMSTANTVQDYCKNNGRILISNKTESLWEEKIKQTPPSEWFSFSKEKSTEKIKELREKCEELFKKKKSENNWETNIQRAEEWCTIED